MSFCQPERSAPGAQILHRDEGHSTEASAHSRCVRSCTVDGYCELPHSARPAIATNVPQLHVSLFQINEKYLPRLRDSISLSGYKLATQAPTLNPLNTGVTPLLLQLLIKTILRVNLAKSKRRISALQICACSDLMNHKT